MQSYAAWGTRKPFPETRVQRPRARDWPFTDNALEGFLESIRPLRTALQSRKRILTGVLEELSAKFWADLS
jgi:hypothetical protein